MTRVLQEAKISPKEEERAPKEAPLIKASEGTEGPGRRTHYPNPLPPLVQTAVRWTRPSVPSTRYLNPVPR